MVDGIAFDKTSYKTGDKVTATVTDSTRTKSNPTSWDTIFGKLTGSFVIIADGKLTTSGYTWTLVSDNGTVAVLTTTA